MSAIAVAVSPSEPGLLQEIEQYFVSTLAGTIIKWSRATSALHRWENEHLLEDPKAEDVAWHKATVERLMRFGVFLSMATEQPDFPDPIIRGEVAATLSCLRRKLEIWHGPRMSLEEADRILAEVFPS